MKKIISPPHYAVGDFEVARVPGGRWSWSVVVDVSGECPIGVGGWARTRLGALARIARHSIRRNR